MFIPRRTSRLLLRAFDADDAAALAERRNEPQVARFQNWTLPFTRQQAEELVTQIVTTGEPTDDRWWMAAIVDPLTGETIGDLAVRLTWGGRSAEVGYTLASRHWGHGYATEALEALLAWLFSERGITRAQGTLHPGNTASARVLERCGFRFEGQTRRSYWVGDECSDDAIYGLTRSDWEAWRARPRCAPRETALVEVTASLLGAVLALRTHHTQEAFVPPAGRALAEGLLPPEGDRGPLVPWLRAVSADGEIVGFTMLALPHDDAGEALLWRLSIDRLHQRRGIGRETLRLVTAEWRRRGGTTLLTRWVEGMGSPHRFFLRHGFEIAGRTPQGEVVGRMKLD